MRRISFSFACPLRHSSDVLGEIYHCCWFVQGSYHEQRRELSTGVAWWLSHDSLLSIAQALAYRILATRVIILAIFIPSTIPNTPYLYYIAHRAASDNKIYDEQRDTARV